MPHVVLIIMESEEMHSIEWLLPTLGTETGKVPQTCPSLSLLPLLPLSQLDILQRRHYSFTCFVNYLKEHISYFVVPKVHGSNPIIYNVIDSPQCSFSQWASFKDQNDINSSWLFWTLYAKQGEPMANRSYVVDMLPMCWWQYKCQSCYYSTGN